MSLLETRDELYTALRGAGLEVALSGGQRVPVPGVIVQPADPWLHSVPTLKRSQRLISWQIVPIAGRADAEGTLAMLAQLIEGTWAAVTGLPGWTTPEVSAPRTITANGADQSGAVLTITRLIDMNGGL